MCVRHSNSEAATHSHKLNGCSRDQGTAREIQLIEMGAHPGKAQDTFVSDVMIPGQHEGP